MRLIMASNRLPINVSMKNNKIIIQESIGGLATGLKSIHKGKYIWIGWPGISLEKAKDKIDEINKELFKRNCVPVFLTKREITNYYYGYCNKTLWPLFHYFPQYATFNKNFWKYYKKVNEKFLNVLENYLKDGDILWIHDYHLMLLPKMVRDKYRNISIGFFLHIPFPSYEIFRQIPERKELLEGILGSDLIGFHIHDYVIHFLNSIRRILGYDHEFGQIYLEDRVIKVDSFPMGIDFEAFEKAHEIESVKKEMEKFRRKLGKRKIILSIDRLDYTKGILQKIRAYEKFLKENAKLKEKVLLLLIVAPSRIKIKEYRNLKKEIDRLVGEINGKYATIDWVPIHYVYKSLSFNTVAALYKLSDIVLITSLRDGMNLISKEFIASKYNNEGVVILSEMAGASKELTEAIIINPNNEDDIANALKIALEMDKNEQKKRMKKMRERIKRYNIKTWFKDFIDKLMEVKKLQEKLSTRILTKNLKIEIVEKYKNSKSRLFLLDYDGTLIPFRENPDECVPDKELIDILKKLSKDERNDVVIISGRDRNSLDRFFKKLKIYLVAEHGAMIRDKKGEWYEIEPLSTEWKDKVREILEMFVSRTPGSFIEEKEFSIAWHYRKVDPELASIRVYELKHILLNLIINLNLDILEGNKVIEIKNSGINKGRAATHFITKRNYDFIIAMGDDVTDEDMFKSLPKNAYTIRIGFEISSAKYNLYSYRDARNLLKEFIKH